MRFVRPSACAYACVRPRSHVNLLLFANVDSDDLCVLFANVESSDLCVLFANVDSNDLCCYLRILTAMICVVICEC